MIAMLYFDKGYAHWAPLFIKSFNIHEPECKFTLYTFNLLESEVDELKVLKNVLFVKNKFMEFDPNLASSWLYQLVCRKGEFLLDTMKKFPDEDLYISADIDMILVQELSELKNQMKGYDIGFMLVSDRKVASGFITINNTKNAKSYIEEFHKRATSGFMEHKKDQPVLAEIYNEVKDEMKFLFLTRQYLDHASSKDAFIWSAHKSDFGNKKERYKKYMRKLNKKELI